MTDRPTHVALREWRAHVTSPPALAALVGLAIVLTAVGAYETDRLLRAVPRFAYWLVIVVATYSAGYAIHEASTRMTRLSQPIRIALAALATALAAFVVVTIINGAAFGHWPGADDILPFFLNILVISAVVSVVLEIGEAHLGGDPAPAGPPPLLERLPMAKRGALLALSVEDHYVRVRTTKGEEMILMRLSDAMKETGDRAGAQVHRSHWVAWDAVADARREGDRAILTLRDGAEVPVSRKYVPVVRDAGLLPR